MKECRHCHKELDDSCFSKNPRNRDGLHSYCKKCVAEIAKEYNRTKGKEKQKRIYKNQIDSGYFRFGHGAFVNMKNSAKKRGVQFDLSEEELKLWWQALDDKCEYCGSTIDQYIKIRDFVLNYSGNNQLIKSIKKTVYNTERTKKISTMTIDRIDSNESYNGKNLVKACWICNSLKSNKMNYTEAKEKLKKINKIILEEMKNE